MATVLVAPAAQKQFDALPVVIQACVEKVYHRLERWPHVSGARPLAGELAGRWRIRTGDYRIQFSASADVVTVEKIGHRDGFYEEWSMSTAEQVVTRGGKRFVLVEEGRWKKLCQLAARGATPVDNLLPAYPPADADGNRPAVAHARVSIARKIIASRQAAGLSQEQLAKLAGIRQETLCRLETGKHSPTVRTVEKIDRALQRATKSARRKGSPA
ncbi:MAG: helix-turn-helix domain-containing protein [Pirellulales bacterium]|nr:helix-turn-helix domain-containing protein [Pirellulales bacterium]